MKHGAARAGRRPGEPAVPGAPLTALLAGATGLVGGECLRGLLASERYSAVIVVTRRDMGENARHPKLTQYVTDFAQLGEQRPRLRAQHVFCALGTTMRKAGSRRAFREVDFEYPLRLAQLARMEGAAHFSNVSAVGANARSPFFYSRVKGEVEDALRGMNWPSLAIFRPSLIAGARAETRPLERVSESLLRLAPAAWRPVAAADIAAAMLAVALDSPPSVTIVESRDIAGRARAGTAEAGHYCDD
jgi:uncharacterized protein YbjT (DUF2867 family)